MRGLVTSRTILVLPNYTLDMQPYIYMAGGVVSETGGVTSDLAIACREVGIPAILGVQALSSKLKDGDMVQLDGNLGGIYSLSKQSDDENASVVTEKTVAKKLSELAGDVAANADTVVEPSSSTKEEIPVEKLPVEASFIAKKDLLTEIMQVQNSDIDQAPGLVKKLFTATKVFALKLGEDVVTQAKTSDGLFYLDLDQLVIENGVHPLAAVEDGKFAEFSKKIIEKLDDVAEKFEGAEVVVSIGSADLGQFRALPRGKKLEDGILSDAVYGATRYMKNPELLKRMLSIVKKLRNVYHNRNISLAIHSPLNGTLMSEIKKEISSNGLRRTSTFAVYAILENPAELILAQDILNSEIDGVIVNTPALAGSMHGMSRSETAAKADLGNGNMLKMVTTAIESASGLKKRVVVVCGDDKTILKHCVNQGVYGVSVDESFLQGAKQIVADEELKLVLGK